MENPTDLIVGGAGKKLHNKLKQFHVLPLLIPIIRETNERTIAVTLLPT